MKKPSATALAGFAPDFRDHIHMVIVISKSSGWPMLMPVETGREGR
jgi:hypothetical protein